MLVGVVHLLCHEGIRSVYLCDLQRWDGQLELGARLCTGNVFSSLLIKLQLSEQCLLLLPQQMQPFLFLQLPLPLQLMLLLTMVVVEHLSAGAQINVLLPEYVNQVHVLKGEKKRKKLSSVCRVVRSIHAVLQWKRESLLWSVAAAPATPCPSVSVHSGTNVYTETLHEL